MIEVRVRIAPSPTGFFHIGSARTALYNWLFARHHKGKFILRVEDTDASRSSKEMISAILDSLKWLGLDWDEGPEKGGDFGPYFQSERKAIYQNYADRLLKEGKAYWCYCTPEEIEKEREEHFSKKINWHHRCRDRYSVEEAKKRANNGLSPALRFSIAVDKKVIFNDLIHGTVEKLGSDLEDFVIIKSDGMATYNFACVIDDYLMKVTHVIRGVEHIANTPKQALLYETFNLNQPAFAHLPVILGTDKKKLSKRLGARSVMEYKEEGYLPEALVNFLALLGWSPGGDEEIMSLLRMTELFLLERINPANAVFDEARLLWMNNQYLAHMLISNELYLERATPFLFATNLVDEKTYKVDNAYRTRVNNICFQMRPRLKILSDIKKASYFFIENFEYDEKILKKYLNPETIELIKNFRGEIQNMVAFDAENIELTMTIFVQKRDVGLKNLIHPLRIFVTGQTGGPGLYETLDLIGKEKVLSRIDNIIKKYEEEIKKQ